MLWEKILPLTNTDYINLIIGCKYALNRIFVKNAFLFYVSNFQKKTFTYALCNSQTDHISVTSWSLVRRPIKSKSRLREHVRYVHSDIDGHQCKTCNKSFKKKSKLNRHMITHLPAEKKPQFPCSICCKVYHEKGTLKMHEDGHSRTTTKCEICNKSVLQIRIHLRTHEDKTVKCQVCGKNLANNLTL